MFRKFTYYNTTVLLPPYTTDFVASILANEGVTLSAPIVAALAQFETALTAAGLINYASHSTNIVKILYPMVGGLASTHKYNFLDPRNLDAAYRVTWAGGITHDANGITGNGVNGIGETHFIPNVLPQNDMHNGVYIRVGSNQSSFYDMGAADASRYCGFVASFSNNYYSSLNDNEYNFGALGLGATGFFLNRRISSTTVKLNYNGPVVATGTKSSSGLVNTSVAICGLNYLGSPVNFSNRNYPLFTWGLNMSDVQAASYYTAIQALQTAFARQV